MRILHTLTFNKMAGAEKVCVNLCNELSKKYEVFLLSYENVLPYIDEKVKFKKIDFTKNRYNIVFLYKIAKIINQINPDVIHTHNAKELEIIHNARFFLNRKFPTVITKHTVKFKNKFHLASLCILVKKEEIIHKNSVIIENAIIYKKPKQLPKKNVFHIISAGRLDEEKGHQNIIKALKNVNFDFHLSIFGKGKYEKKLKELTKTLNMQDKISFEGFVDNIQDYLNICDLQIVASDFESFGLVIAEGLFYSKLLISTPVGISKEILPNDFIFENNISTLTQKLNEIYQDYEKYTNEFAKVKKNKEKYDINTMIDKHIKAYKDLIK